MSIAANLVTAAQLEFFPVDGKRREVVEGLLYVSPAPTRIHQTLSFRLAHLLFEAINKSGAGEAFSAPVDVRFSELDQVQPDLIAIRRERLGMYQGHVVNGAPDIVVEILSLSSRQYDEVEKMRLYAGAGVPEYWIVDPDRRQMTIYRLAGDGYEASAPIDGLLHSAAVTEFTVDPDALFADLLDQD